MIVSYLILGYFIIRNTVNAEKVDVAFIVQSTYV